MSDASRSPDVTVLHPTALAAALDLAGGDMRRLRIVSPTEVYVLNRPGTRLPEPAPNLNDPAVLRAALQLLDLAAAEPSTTRARCSPWHHSGPCWRCHQHKPVRGMLYCQHCAERLGGNRAAGHRVRVRVRVRGVVSGGLPTLGKRR